MKNPSIKTLRRKLKRIFSEYIRRRDAHVPFMLDRRGKCCTCGKWFRWKDAHAGHYVEVGSATQGTEYDERNVHLQCCHCNTFCEGKKAQYTLFMEAKYGKGIIEELVKQSKWTLVGYVQKKFDFLHSVETTQDAYKFLIRLYSQKLEGLK